MFVSSLNPTMRTLRLVALPPALARGVVAHKSSMFGCVSSVGIVGNCSEIGQVNVGRSGEVGVWWRWRNPCALRWNMKDERYNGTTVVLLAPLGSNIDEPIE